MAAGFLPKAITIVPNFNQIRSHIRHNPLPVLRPFPRPWSAFQPPARRDRVIATWEDRGWPTSGNDLTPALGREGYGRKANQGPRNG